jgi:hypothetical protein
VKQYKETTENLKAKVRTKINIEEVESEGDERI